MASARISPALNPHTKAQWRAMLRETLRECSYLPDPIARTYMHDYVLSNFRKKQLPPRASQTKKLEAAQRARKGLSILKRANEGYQKPLEKVLNRAYGRSGGLRREYLRQLCNEVPADSDAVKELINQPLDYEDGWQPPAIIIDLLKSQMSNGHVQSKRGKALLEPPIPKQDSWGESVSEVRRRNIRRRWYTKTLNSLLPPLPKEQQATLDGLISSDIPWAPPQRRRGKHEPAQDNAILKLLVDGPQKGHTFGDYANGRPHVITTRFMRHQWRRISCLVPRMHCNEHTSKMSFTWDVPKPMPQYIFEAGERMDIDQMMDFEERDEPELLGKGSSETNDPLSQPQPT